ncbi:MAG: DUF1800 domain-containing protein [Saprospiraceae bacterium]|nr:DUF1800 domain-containing protein [Pyrinomonadaceae bacterium]
MVKMRSHASLRIITASLAVCLFAINAFAQVDSDPNSPTPIILSAEGSANRAMAMSAAKSRRSGKAGAEDSFAPHSRVVLFIKNIDLLEDEGANAFRVYAQDSTGREYRFPVLGLRPATGEMMERGVYALTTLLRDEIGYAEPPAEGDVLIRVAWRGLTSDRLRIGYGTTGGNIKDDVQPYSTLMAGGGSKDQGDVPDANFVGYRWSGDRIRFLEQATFGPTSALDSRIRRIGLRTYLAEQFEAPFPSVSNPYPNFPLKSTDQNNTTTGCGMFTDGTLEQRICDRDHYSMYPVQKWHFTEAFYGEPQLRHRVTWALSQIWVISGFGGDTQQSRWMTEYHKILSANAFGNYRTLMGQMTRNPGMGNYLSMARSTKNNPNENYAREILQLFTTGLFMLNQDGTQQMSGGQPIATYDQNTVNSFTKVFTGFGFCETTGPNCPNRALGAPNYIDPLLLNQNNHDVTAKTLFNYPGAPNATIPAATNGNTEMEMALDNIFNHPNVGPFVSKLLIQHLVTSDPTPAYVARIAAVFNNNGLSVRGDLKAVIKAILLDPEARGDVKTDPNYGKLREPMQFVTNMARTFNVKAATAALPSDGVVAGLLSPLAQNPFNSPTVFNYYSPDFTIPGAGLLAPEFHIMTTSTSVARANVMNTLVFSRVNVSENAPNGTSLDFTEMTAIATADPTCNQLLDALNNKMMHGTMSAAMRTAILNAIIGPGPQPVIPANNPLLRAQQAVYLVATSSQFQIQR